MKKKIIILSSLLLAILLVSFYFTIYRKSTENESQKITYKSNSHSKVKRSDIQIFGDKKQYVLAPSSLIVGKKYAIDSEKRWAILPEKEQTFSKEHLQKKGEYWNLILYNLEEEGLPERKIDLYQAVRSYDKKSVPLELIGCYYLGGEHYFRLTIENLSEEQPTFKDVYLNLETEKIEELPENTRLIMDSDIYNTTSLTNFSEVLRSRGYNRPENQLLLTIEPKGKNPDLNINLYSLYPDIESKLIKEDWALYVRTDKVTPDEWFDTLLYWFATKGEDVLPVYGYNDDSSVSDTQIHNSQEAKAWLEQHPALQKN